ncbi:MAG: hypothetical protein ABI583_03445 [Betaproteobacteria bacterium]
MKHSIRIIAVALLASSSTFPAFAAVPPRAGMENLGTVDVSRQPDRDVVYNRFGGAMERLQLRATDSDINCRSVTARFGNGRSRQIFSGRLVEGRAVNVDLPGDARHVSSLTFNCRADERWGGKVRILADVGQNRAEWMRSPDWPRVWSQLFSGGNDNRVDGRGESMRGRNAPNDDTWSVIGEERFEGRGDHEVASAGWRGNGIRAIALMPVESDARCGRVRADFEHGDDQDLDIGDRLRRGQYNRADLPGNRRDLVKLTLRCHAEGARNVTIRIYGQR